MLDLQKVQKDIKDSPLYSDDLAPLPHARRTWTTFDIAALWIGVAVCIPTYLLASYMIRAGLLWWEALIIVIVGNLLITIPMVLNGRAGVKYGLPFPVLARSAFGTRGVHVATLLRGFVACGWFGVQTWIGGLSIYAIACTLWGLPIETQLTSGQFIGFGVFWLINAYFIWRGTEQIRFLEELAAPLLILVGVLLIAWGWYNAGSFSAVLEQSEQLSRPTMKVYEAKTSWGERTVTIALNPIREYDTRLVRAHHYRLFTPNLKGSEDSTDWLLLSGGEEGRDIRSLLPNANISAIVDSLKPLRIQLKTGAYPNENFSSIYPAEVLNLAQQEVYFSTPLWQHRAWNYVYMLTVIVGFWATMAISIADITRFTARQSSQIIGQFAGLPTTMTLYSFVGIFVTCAAIISFQDILIPEDAPWNPVALLSRFENPAVVILAQFTMLLATLSTNIAANIIAPAFALTNLLPRHLSFRSGGVAAALIGVLLCPWWLMDSISNLLLFISGLLGPVLGVMMSDYFWLRRQELDLQALYDPQGKYGGFHLPAFIALFVGVASALVGWWVPALSGLYTFSWFTGFAISFLLYRLLARA